jgi:hypothetical protein
MSDDGDGQYGGVIWGIIAFLIILCFIGGIFYVGWFEIKPVHVK